MRAADDWRLEWRWTAKVWDQSFDVDFQASLLAPATGIEPRPSKIERRRFRDQTTTRRGGSEVAWVFVADLAPDPELVVRRVGHLARIEDLAGVPYSEPMPIPEAISALREIIE